MKLILTNLKYDWDKDEDSISEVKALFFKLTGKNEVVTYTDLWVTEEEYINNYKILNSIIYVREI